MARRITLGGVVQGVGFRPFVYRLARGFSLRGWVRNGAGIVEIMAAGDDAALAEFTEALLTQAPNAARPVLLSNEPAEWDGEKFEIRESVGAGEAMRGLPPDLGPCADCLRELKDPKDRRYRYPFINCTQCGPRYSIIRTLPYDRANTTMAQFVMCKACAVEYENPGDRRFHAEPVACADCGPRCWFGEATGEAALAACIAALRAGQIIAVKGVGGYHLFCDAASEVAVAELRRRKHRPDKPLAVLVPDEAAPEVLRSPARPILLMPKRENLAPGVAPGLDEVGVMLADSPLHHLLVEGFGGPLVATSANRSGEPMLTDAAQAERDLAGIADGFLHHDRPIARAVDDSVLRMIEGTPRIIRAGRGISPVELRLPFTLPQPVLAVGGHMKSTLALGFEDRVVISPHLGDLDNPQACAQFSRMAADLQGLYGVRAEVILADAHAGYASTVWARRQGLRVVPVWHHFAHASALAGEVGATAPMLVFTWDGVGLGPDGTLWGGEALLGRPGGWRVVARMRRMRLQGGDAVAREPWRSAAAMCWHTGAPGPGGLARQAWDAGVNCHESSAVGRLFDGAAALLGLCDRASFEGQGPMLLEACAGGLAAVEGLPEADWGGLVPMLMDEGLPRAVRAARFQGALVATALEISRAVRREFGVEDVGLAGGVFQNRAVAEGVLAAVRAEGMRGYLGRAVPCNDAGLSFGQVVEFGGRGFGDAY
jgi:hydrogenase maturation protein HypF